MPEIVWNYWLFLGAKKGLKCRMTQREHPNFSREIFFSFHRGKSIGSPPSEPEVDLSKLGANCRVSGDN